MIIEGEMKRTMKRISEGCQPFTNAVEAEKNDLFALALSKLNTSRNSLQFLDICSSIAQLKSKNAASACKTIIETSSVRGEIGLISEGVVSDAIIKLYREIYPNRETDEETILETIREWSFKHVPLQVETINEDSDLSLVGETQRRSFVEMRMATFEAIDGGKGGLEERLLAILRAADNPMRRQQEPRYLPSPKRRFETD